MLHRIARTFRYIHSVPFGRIVAALFLGWLIHMLTGGNGVGHVRPCGSTQYAKCTSPG